MGDGGQKGEQIRIYPEMLGSVEASLAVVRIKHHQVHRTNAAKTTSVTKTPE